MPTHLSPIGGGADDAAAINAAFAIDKSVVLEAGVFTALTQIVVPPNGLLRGQARGTVVQKNFNGDLLDLKYGAQLVDLTLDGHSYSKTGRGVVIRDGQHYQRIYNCNITAEGYCLELEGVQSGGHLTVEECFITRTPNLQAYSIKLPDNDGMGGNRTFRAIRASGGYGIDLAGAGNTMLDRCNMSMIRMNDPSRTTLVQNCRLGGPIEWRGIGHWVAFNNVNSGHVITSMCTDSVFIVTRQNAPVVRQDPAGNNNVVW